ncbi:MAG: 2-amino-4-hydroxy-6-hydroxymethyldihydropteridine diphosphokinase [Wenzhouxiangellaceae bacterium]|nr:2-amino-4-hydroxy-6-hydroxymethyldihydropteridine diphosphokinase [Wenzhouxiangellaceae bacterium]
MIDPVRSTVAPAWIGLGSNLDGPERQIERALDALAALPDTELIAASPRYRTAPVGDAEQPDFVNAVAELRTRLAPEALLDALLQIENRQGRRRDPARPNGPRTLDLDLLVYADLQQAGERLVVPHPRLAQRAFVLKPLADLAPTLEVPGQGRVDRLLAAVDVAGVELLLPADGHESATRTSATQRSVR